MAAAIAAAEALEKLTGSANEASNVLANLSSKTEIIQINLVFDNI